MPMTDPDLVMPASYRAALQETVLHIAAAPRVGFNTDGDGSNFSRWLDAADRDVKGSRSVYAGGRPRVFTQPAGVDVDSWQRYVAESTFDPGVDDTIKRITCVARGDDPAKDVESLVMAYDLAHDRYPYIMREKTVLDLRASQTRAVRIGRPYAQTWQSLHNAIAASTSPIIWRNDDENFTFANIAGYYHTSAVHAVPSIREALSLTALEVIACADPNRPPILLMTAGTGAADYIGNHALELNPTMIAPDPDGIYLAEALPNTDHIGWMAAELAEAVVMARTGVAKAQFEGAVDHLPRADDWYAGVHLVA